MPELVEDNELFFRTITRKPNSRILYPEYFFLSFLLFYITDILLLETNITMDIKLHSFSKNSLKNIIPLLHPPITYSIDLLSLPTVSSEMILEICCLPYCTMSSISRIRFEERFTFTLPRRGSDPAENLGG